MAPADSANHSIGTSISCGEVDRREHPTALGLGDRAHRPGGVAEHGDSRDALRVALGRACVTTPTTTPARFRAGRPVDRHEPAVVVQVVLDERAALAGEQRHQFVGVDEPSPPGLDDLAGVVVERLHRRSGGVGETHGQTPPGS